MSTSTASTASVYVYGSMDPQSVSTSGDYCGACGLEDAAWPVRLQSASQARLEALTREGDPSVNANVVSTYHQPLSRREARLRQQALART